MNYQEPNEQMDLGKMQQVANMAIFNLNFPTETQNGSENPNKHKNTCTRNFMDDTHPTELVTKFYEA